MSDCVDTWRIAKLTEGFSGSDLRELCRVAALQRLYRVPEASLTADLSRGNQTDRKSACRERVSVLV